MRYLKLIVALGTVLVLHVLIPTSSNAKKYYVKSTSTPNSHCPPDSGCYTLNEYAYNHTNLFRNHPDNVTLIFMEGSHILFYDLSITHIQNVTITVANVTGDNINARLFVLKKISLVNVS